MNKKKVRAASTRRKRKVSKPRSNDSGVSLKSTNDINVTVDNFETNDSSTPEECNKKLKKEDTAKEDKCSDRPFKIDPISEKVQLTFIEDEPCLDYEPSEDEVNSKYCAASNNKRKQKKSEEVENNSNKKTEVLPTAVSTNTGSDCKLLNSIDSTIKEPDISCSFGDTNKISETCNLDEIMIIEGEEDKILEEYCDSDDQTESCSENQLPSKEEEHFNALFHNAKVHFNGPLNITISRPITNNSQNQVSSKTVSNTLQNINSSQVHHGSSNVQIHKMSTLLPVKNIVNEKHVKKKKWPNSLSDISNQRITSNDIIFSDNENYTGVLQRISAKLPDGDEKNTECTRESEKTKLDWHDDNQSSFISNFTYSLNTRPNSRSLIPQYHPKKICKGDGNQMKQPSVVLEDCVSALKRPSISDGAILPNTDDYELKEHDKEAFVARWLMHNNEDCFSKLLNSLCESHFSTGCTNTRCSKTHTTEEIKKMIQQSSFQEFEEYYNIALQKDSWFTWLFDIFIEYLTVVLNVGEMRLIDMINDVSKVFNSTFTDKTSYILKIIDALKKMGLSFKQAIKRIILRYGTTQLWICDILLFIIASESNLEDHWCLVQKITCCRKEKIDHEVVTELLMASLKNSPQNKELWKMIYQDIFEKNLVDLTKIPRHLKEFVVKMARNHTELHRKVLIPDLNNMERSSGELFQPINPIIRVRNEILSSVERSASHLQDRIKDISNDSSNSYVSDDMPKSKKSVELLNGLRASRHGVATASSRYSQRKPISVNSRLDEKKSWIPKVSKPSRGISDRVLRNFVKSRNVIRKPPTPANIIAHPSCQPIIDPLYQCNISLHNLLPEVHGSLVDISTSDLRRLKNALRDVNAVEFLDILQIYSDPSSVESFIVNVLTLFKSIRKSASIYSTFTSLLEALEKVDCGYMKETSVKVPIEVLALNLFFMLNTKGRWHLSRNILFKMKDWHNLVTSKIYLRKSNLKSHMGRYIYMIKVLIRAEDFSWANEILQAEALKLLGSPTLWPYECKLSDMQDRNRVLETFMDKCFPKNIFIANDLLKHIVLMHSGAIDGFDLWTWFNNKIILLTEEELYRTTLVFLSSDISNYYGQYMDKHVLQTYMLHMVNSITIEMAMKMFKMCCDKGIYHRYTGEEHVVCVTTNLSDFEITSLLECYFENFRIGRVSPHDFFIDLQLTTEEEPTICEKFRINRSVYKVFEIVCNILDSRYQIKIDQPVQSRIFVSLSN